MNTDIQLLNEKYSQEQIDAAYAKLRTWMVKEKTGNATVHNQQKFFELLESSMRTQTLSSGGSSLWYRYKAYLTGEPGILFDRCIVCNENLVDVTCQDSRCLECLK